MSFSEDSARADRIVRGLSESGSESIPVPSRYEVRSRAGEGVTAVVYRAWDWELKRPVAIKVLREHANLSDIARQRFRREAETAAGLAHPHLIHVFDAGESEGQLWIVMELVDGRPFSELLQERRIPERDLIGILERASRGLGEAHQKGIVHRDLKPANILVTADGTPKVGDFGLAHLLESKTELTKTGSTLGTPLYMAPEQVEGRPKEITARTDVYALGAILYEILTSQTPHLGETPGEIYGKIVREDPLPPRKLRPTVSRDLETIAQKALEKDPGKRYLSATHFAEDLRRSLEGEPIEARPISRMERLWRKGLRRRAVLLPLLGAILLGSLLGFFAARKSAPRGSLVYFERTEGDTRILRGAESAPASQGQALGIGQEVKTGPWPSFGILRFEDGTRVEIGPESSLVVLGASSEKRLSVRRGTLVARNSGLPREGTLALETPSGEARAAAATLRLLVDPDLDKGTRLEVETGMAELRSPDGKAVVVGRGSFGRARRGELSVRPLATSSGRPEILLDDFKDGVKSWKVVHGDESLGTPGSFAHDPTVGHNENGSARLQAEFTKGGKFIGAWFDLRSFPNQGFKEIRFWVKTNNVKVLGVRFSDSSGQIYQNEIILAPIERWQEVVLRFAQLASHDARGGASDGRWRGPPTGFGIHLGPASFVDPDSKSGSLWIDDVEGIGEGKLAGGAILDPSFEEQTQGDGKALVAPWSGEGPAQIGVDSFSGYQGFKCGYIYDGPGRPARSDISQTVTVTPNTSYSLSAWLETSTPFFGGTMGVRTGEGSLIAEQPYGQIAEYARVRVNFNSGPHHSLVVFAGFKGVDRRAGVWIHVDNWSLVAAGSK